MTKTILSKKGQVVIPKPIRDQLGLTPGTVLEVHIEGKSVVLEPVQGPPEEVFVRAGAKLTDSLLQEAKAASDKAQKLLEDLGVSSD
jgi:AbrB family looped-hinge helix DNA binding protein